MVFGKEKRKYKRVLFATDIHASEVVFRKFLGGAKFYGVDALIMGGDVTGKTVVPVVEQVDGKYSFNVQGQSFEGVSKGELLFFEERMMNSTLYPHRVAVREYEDMLADQANVSAVFERLMVERLNRWALLAEEHLPLCRENAQEPSD